ncbi:unnamed protein product [Symbiodinium sp. CCMP2456]|nr:unnamed protein product [Symbiodinium sp. CCMP2456]
MEEGFVKTSKGILSRIQSKRPSGLKVLRYGWPSLAVMAEVLSSEEEQPEVEAVAGKPPASKTQTEVPKEPKEVQEAKVPPSRKRPATEPLPYGWVRKASKTKKGAYYYANILTGKTQVNRPGPRTASASGHRQRANRSERLEVSGSAPAVSEELRQRQAEHDAAAEAELEEVKRKAAERRAAQKAMETAPDDEGSEESGSADDENVTGEACSFSASGWYQTRQSLRPEDVTKWKQEEELREKKQAEREEKERLSWPAASELPPVPRVLQPCLDVLKDGKWVERHVLGSDKQRWTLGRAVGEVDFPMNHSTISRQHAALTRGGGGIYLVDQSVHGVQVDAQRIEKNLRVLLKNGAMIKFGASTRLYVYHEPT